VYFLENNADEPNNPFNDIFFWFKLATIDFFSCTDEKEQNECTEKMTIVLKNKKYKEKSESK
jgi:hypothetical protein